MTATGPEAAVPSDGAPRGDALVTRGLTRKYGALTAARCARSRGQGRRDLRSARTERRRQVDHDQDADHAPAADQRHRDGRRRRHRRASPARSDAGSATCRSSCPPTVPSRPGRTCYLSARLYHLPRDGRDAAIAEALEFMGLPTSADRQVRTYLGRHDPPARARPGDAPPSGRPVPRRADRRARPDRAGAVWERVARAPRRDGTTILLTTHYMDEADALCDRIAVMHRGPDRRGRDAGRASRPRSGPERHARRRLRRTHR